MAVASAKSRSVFLVGGSDEFSIKETAARRAAELAPKQAGEFGLEIIDGDASNQDEALRVLARLTEALQTVGLFGGEKLVWLKNTSLLGDDPTTRAEAVRQALGELAELLKRGLPEGVTLLISAIGLDRRKSLYKTIEKLGEVRFFEAMEAGEQQTEQDTEAFIRNRLREEGKTMTDDALEVFRELVAVDRREIANELEKLFLYVGKRREITGDDVRAICSASRPAVIWDLVEALGARRAPAAIRALECLLEAGESPIGVLMMLAGQFRLMLLVRDLVERKILSLRDGPGAGFEFVKALERLPEHQLAHFPRGKDGRLPNAWRLYRCALAARNFSERELVAALERMLEAHMRLVSTQLDARLVLEQLIVNIARPPVSA
jgi:DNA polymerase-3 subunit delta